MTLAPFRFAAAVASVLVPLTALADPTAEQAQGLEHQFRGWIEQTLGSGIKIPEGLFQVAPEGDHYRISMRLAAVPLLSGIQGGDLAISMQPLPEGRWLLYDYRFASPLKFHIDLPIENSAGLAGPGPMDFSIGYGKLDGDAIVDPSFATPSVAMTRIAGYDTDAAGSRMRQRMHADAMGGQASLIPSGAGRIDVIEEAAADNFSFTAKAADPQQSPAVFLGRVDVALQILGLDRDRLVSAIQNLVRLATGATGSMSSSNEQNAPAADESPKRLNRDRESLRDLYMTVRGMVTGGELRESFEDLRTEMGGHMVALSRVSLGWGVNTPNGMLIAHLSFAVDGITAPDIPAEVRGYVPRHLLVRQNLSGIDLGDVDALIMAAIASGAAPSMEQPEIAERVKAIFAHGGITAGLDALEVDLGSTSFTATGKVTALSPDHVKGQADVTVTGFDALVAQVQTSREWGKVAPFLQLLGKLGRADGERIVWTITADNADVKVNGLDIPALIAASKAR